MTTLLLAMLAAGTYGFSDFVGGILSRRTSAWPVATIGAFGGFLSALVLAVTRSGSATPTDLAWGVLAGVGSGAGGAFLYRGLASGRMGVVAPVSAVGSAVLPVLAGLLGGERPPTLVWLGIACGLPGVWLVSREVGSAAVRGGTAAGVVDGLLAGTGFGLLFAATGQVPEGHGYWPLAVTQGVSVLAVVLIAVLLRQDWRPRQAGQLLALAPGILATLALLAFILSTQAGLLTVTSVVTSLYPAVTVLLAVAVLREGVHRGQLVGLALCLASVGLIAAA